MFEEDDEPIRVISTEEAERLMNAPPSPAAPAAPVLAKDPVPTDEEIVELGRRIWKAALDGLNRDQIAQKLRVSIEVLEQTLNAYQLRLGASIDRYRMLDNARLDRLITYWLPKAVTKMRVLSIKGQEAIITEDFDRPMKAAYFVMQALSNRAKVMGASVTLAGSGEPSAGGLAGAKEYSERNITIWLREVMPSIERITREIEVEITQCPSPNQTKQ
jgi:hypothetical protein